MVFADGFGDGPGVCYSMLHVVESSVVLSGPISLDNFTDAMYVELASTIR